MKPLKFVHVSKNAGSSIEDWGHRNGFKWGKHDKGVGEEYTKNGLTQGLKDKCKSEVWHAPTAWFQKNPYAGSDAFMVLRDPMDRVISEFRCNYKGFRGFSPNREEVKKEDLNRWIHNKLRNYKAKGFWEGLASKTNCHMLPQYLYAQDSNGKKIIPADRMLPLRGLQQSFTKMIHKYYPDFRGVTTLETTNSSTRIPKFTGDDVSDTNKRLIEEAYKKDYQLLSSLRESNPTLNSKAPSKPKSPTPPQHVGPSPKKRRSVAQKRERTLNKRAQPRKRGSHPKNRQTKNFGAPPKSRMSITKKRQSFT